jgi:sulfite reductase (NADPH) flavoprotein alpha-component
MNQTTPRPPVLEILPESAPFTPEQRTWLNGFFAGLLQLDAPATPLSAEEAAALLPGLIAPASTSGGTVADADDGAPWHDPAIEIGDRMKLAEGRPLPRRMMAAMAQQDCGQCGSSCEEYSLSIFQKKEERLNLCVPGGKDTSRMLKKLYEEAGASPAPAPAAAPAAEAAPPSRPPAAAPGRSRDHPVDATVVSRVRLNKPGSEKETWHVEFDLTESGLDYVVGDSFGIMPVNDPALVDAIFTALAAPRIFPSAAARCARCSPTGCR